MRQKNNNSNKSYWLEIIYYNLCKDGNRLITKIEGDSTIAGMSMIH